MGLTVAADVMHSLAQEPGVRTIPGFQAWCQLHWEDGDLIVIGDNFVDGVWVGAWHEHWIDARIDAVAHNMIKHPHSYAPEPSTDWWNF
jgi:hypothetical protein